MVGCSFVCGREAFMVDASRLVVGFGWLCLVEGDLSFLLLKTIADPHVNLTFARSRTIIEI